MKIAYIKDKYPEERTIINKVNGIQYIKINRFNNIYK